MAIMLRPGVFRLLDGHGKGARLCRIARDVGQINFVPDGIGAAGVVFDIRQRGDGVAVFVIQTELPKEGVAVRPIGIDGEGGDPQRICQITQTSVRTVLRIARQQQIVRLAGIGDRGAVICDRDPDTFCADDDLEQACVARAIIILRTYKGDGIVIILRLADDKVLACGRRVVARDFVPLFIVDGERIHICIAVYDRLARAARQSRGRRQLRIRDGICAVHDARLVGYRHGDRALLNGQFGGVGKGEGVVADGKGALRRAAERHLHGKGAARCLVVLVAVSNDGKLRFAQNGRERFAACKGFARRSGRAAGKLHLICYGIKIKLRAVGGGICIFCKGDGHRAGGNGINAVVCLPCICKGNGIVAVDGAALFRLGRAKDVIAFHGKFFARRMPVDIQAVRLSIAGNDGALSVIRPARDRAELFRRRQSLQRVAVFARLICDRHLDRAGGDGIFLRDNTGQSVVAERIVIFRKRSRQRIFCRVFHLRIRRDRERYRIARYRLIGRGNFAALFFAAIYKLDLFIPVDRDRIRRYCERSGRFQPLCEVRIVRTGNHSVAAHVDGGVARLFAVSPFSRLPLICDGEGDFLRILALAVPACSGKRFLLAVIYKAFRVGPIQIAEDARDDLVLAGVIRASVVTEAAAEGHGVIVILRSADDIVDADIRFIVGNDL